MRSTVSGHYDCCMTTYTVRLLLDYDTDTTARIIREQHRVFDLMHLHDHPECDEKY